METEHAEAVRQLRASNEARASLYRTLAYYYLHELTEPQIEQLAHADLASQGAGNATMQRGFNEMAGYLLKLTTGTRQELAVDYAHTFLAAGNYETFAATPYESVFTSEEGLMMQDARDEVYKMYCAEHMQPKDELHMPEDHIAFEFEFMALLIDRMNEGLVAGDFDRACHYAEVQRAFHRDHQLNWIDDLCDAIEDVALTVFYVGLADVTRGFVHAETEAIADETALAGELAGSPAPAMA
ncbi:MAG: molecular chaperone TorD family protein [Eggerthellaceae bacterium]|jgi:TorA maturation chaperone TorD